MEAAELTYWKDRYAEHGLEYHPRQGFMAGGHTATWDQTAFRFRLDDGREDLQESDGGATWAAGLNVDLTSWPENRRFRLRYLMDRTAVDTSFHNFRMWYSHTPSGGSPSAYSQILLPGGSPSFVTFLGSYWIIDQGEPTDFTGRLGSSTWGLNPSDVNWGLMDATTQIRVIPRNAANADVEMEWSFELIPADVGVGDTVDFRIRTSVGNEINSYVNTPRITIAAAESLPPAEDLLVSP